MTEQEAKENLKYFRTGLIWALQRMGLVIACIAAVIFTLYLICTCFPAFLVEVVIIGIIWMTIYKAREEYWNDNKEYPTMKRLVKGATNTGPR